MPKYRVQLKQGKRTITEHIEAKNLSSLLAFYDTLTTLKVSEVLEVLYEDKTQPPVDDFQYRSLFKGMIKNSDQRKTKQIILHNIKTSKNESDIYAACIAYLDLDGFSVDAVTAFLFKN